MKTKTKKKIQKQALQEDRLIQRRFVAFFIDWVIIAFLINGILIFSHAMITGEVSNDNYFPGYAGQEGYLLGGMALAVSFFYMVIFPYLTKKKETLGKKWMHVQIVDQNGDAISFSTRCLRFLITLLLESRLFNFSMVFYLLLSMITGISLGTAFEVISWALTIGSGLCGLFTSKGMFHDWLLKTKVVRVKEHVE